MRLIAYYRVSSTRGREDDLISVEVQRTICEGYAAQLGMTIVSHWEELDVSGSKMDRPILNRVIDAVMNGEADGIIVAKINRFARNVADGAKLVQQLDAAGKGFVSAYEKFDPVTPFGRFARTLFFSLAELELDVIRDNWHHAIGNAIGKGKHLRATFGYLKTRDGLVPDPATAEYVMRAFTMRAEGESYGAIRREFAEAGLTTARGNAWSSGAIQSMLRSKTYLGIAWHGDQEKADAHEPLVDRPTWEAAQSPGTVRIDTAGKRNLSGIARCAACGYAMVAAPRAKDKGGDVYTCSKHHSFGRCPEPTSVPIAKLDAFVWDALLQYADNLTMESAEDVADIREVEQRLGAAEADMRVYTSMSATLGEHFLPGFHSRKENIDVIRAELADARARVGRAALPDRTTLEAERETMSPEQLRRVFGAAFGAVFVRRAKMRAPLPTRVEIVPRKELAERDIVLPRRGNREACIRPYLFASA